MSIMSAAERIASRYIPKGYEILYQDERGIVYGAGLLAIGYQGTSKNNSFHIRFRDEARRDVHIADFFVGLAWAAQVKANQEAEAKAKKAELVSTLAVGDILYRSWGYDQTNVDFYQVVKRTPKSVMVVPIHGETTEDGFMCGTTIPVKDSFREASPVSKRIRKGGAGDLSLWDGLPKRCSWYA